jgi:hypothetical protein
MALADDLLEQANHLANHEPKRPRQASLRQAVSTAYYSLFHLLISSAISQWKSPRQRAQMARGFEHTAMKDASKKIAGTTLRCSKLDLSRQRRISLTMRFDNTMYPARHWKRRAASSYRQPNFLSLPYLLAFSISQNLGHLGRADAVRSFRDREEPEEIEEDINEEVPPVRGSSRTICLRGGGSATLSFDVDVWSMTPEDQQFVFDMIKRMTEYEQAKGAGQ